MMGEGTERMDIYVRAMVCSRPTPGAVVRAVTGRQGTRGKLPFKCPYAPPTVVPPRWSTHGGPPTGDCGRPIYPVVSVKSSRTT